MSHLISQLLTGFLFFYGSDILLIIFVLTLAGDLSGPGGIFDRVAL